MIYLQAVPKSGLFVYADDASRWTEQSPAQVAKPPHFSRRWHNRSNVLLSPSRYNGAKSSEYLSGID